MGCGSAKISNSTTRHPSSSAHENTSGRDSYDTERDSNAVIEARLPPYRVSTHHTDYATTTTAISGNARIRVTLSGDGSLLEIETERFLQEDEERELFNQRISACSPVGSDDCPGCLSLQQPSTSQSTAPLHTCGGGGGDSDGGDLGNTFFYHRHLLDNSLIGSSHSKAIHSSLPDFRKLYRDRQPQVAVGEPQGPSMCPRGDQTDHACQTWDLPLPPPPFPLEQLTASPRPLRPRPKPCTASQGFTCLEYCAKECYKHVHSSIQPTDSSFIGLPPVVKSACSATTGGGKNSSANSNSSSSSHVKKPRTLSRPRSNAKLKDAAAGNVAGMVKRSRTFDVPPDGGVIDARVIAAVSPHLIRKALGEKQAANTYQPVKRSSTFDGHLDGASGLPNGDVKHRSHTCDDVKASASTASTPSNTTPTSFLASLTTRYTKAGGRSTESPDDDMSYTARLKRFTRQSSVRSASAALAGDAAGSSLSRDSSHGSQSTKYSVLSRQSSTQSSPGAEAGTTSSKLRRRLFGRASKTLPEIASSSLPMVKYSVGQHGRKGPVLRSQSEELIDEGLDLSLSDLTVHQNFYNDFGDIFDEDNLES